MKPFFTLAGRGGRKLRWLFLIVAAAGRASMLAQAPAAGTASAASPSPREETFHVPEPPPDDGKPGMVEVGSVAAGGWELRIGRDGAGVLYFGAADMAFFPAGTFAFDEVCAKLALIGKPEPEGKGISYAHDDFAFSYGNKRRFFYVERKDTVYFAELFKLAVEKCTGKDRFESIAKSVPFIRSDKER